MLFNPFDSMSFAYDKCFLCGNDLLNNDSDEHVFPRWLQSRFNLWNEKMILLNKTEIPYRQLTIPCCPICNNQHLSNIERQVQRAIDGGFDVFRNLDEIIIYQWTAKIFYGILFKELSLPFDRRNPNKGNITDPDLLEKFKMLHVFLQSVRIPFKFERFTPWSIFIFKTMSFGDRRDFDYHDSLMTLTFSIRMRDIGIIACLEDNGIQKEMFNDYFKRYEGIELHPIQFDEMFTKVTYKSSLMNRTPKYIISLPTEAEDETKVITLPLQGFSNLPVFNEWDQETYAQCLFQFWEPWGIEFEDIFKEPNLVLSLLHKDDGTPIVLNPDGTRVE